MLSSLFCFASLPTLFAQKHCDLRVTIVSPVEGEVIPYGETAELNFSITNLGPDDLSAMDSVYIAADEDPVYSLYLEDIASGDSVVLGFFSTANNEEEDYEFSTCLYVVSELNSSFIDSIQVNDTSCVNFVLKGSGTSNIEDHESSKDQLILYPNPAYDLVNLKLRTRDLELSEVVITDLQGRYHVRKKIETPNKDSFECRIDVSKLSTGIYIINVGSPSRWIHHTLIVR